MPPSVLSLLVVLFILIALFGVFFFYLFWWLMQRTVPKLDGEVHLACLSAQVKILRDKHGIPHIYAQNRADLFRAQGYIHAQDRLWQMDQNRRIANGTLSECFGLAALEVDRFSRVIGFARAASAEFIALDEEECQVLEWYSEGINAYIAGRPGRLAAEFNLLRRQPSPWTPLDTLAFARLMAWRQSINWEGELVRLQLGQQLDPIRAADLEPDYPPRNPVVTDGVGSDRAMNLLNTAGLLLEQYEQVKKWLGPQGAGLGSNGWAVAPRRSITGKAMLCNDPHLSLTMPGIWYENHLECPDFQVSGVTLPGTPAVAIGHNEHIAWGMANACVDAQDTYIERLHPEDPTRYEYQGHWENAQVFHERINVRGQSVPHVETVVMTHHGPLISGIVGDHSPVPLALSWTGHEPGYSLRAVLRLNQARNWDEFDEALADWQAPVQNLVYADDEGNIGFRMAGRVPIRKNGLGLVPAPGWSGDYEWSGYILSSELPSLQNPHSGLIVTANNKVTGDDYPYFLGVEFFPGWRAQRIEEMLEQKGKLAPRDMQQIQLDTISSYARALAPWLTTMQTDDPWEKTALTSLREWGHNMAPDSQAALVFHYTLLHLLEMAFGEKLGPSSTGFLGSTISPLFTLNGFMHRAETRLLEIITHQAESFWYTDTATGRQRTRSEFLHEGLSRAVRRIRSDVNESPRRWEWGRMHQVRFNHPLGSVRLLAGFLNRGPFPLGGDGTTPNQATYPPRLPPGLVQVAASYRQIYEVGSWDQAQTVTTSGQSGHPFSPNYADQIPIWLEGDYHAMPWNRQAVEDTSIHCLTLIPTPGLPVAQPSLAAQAMETAEDPV